MFALTRPTPDNVPPSPPPPPAYGYLPKIMLHVNTETKGWQQAVGNLSNLANFSGGKNQIRTLAFTV
jgi:hypothetical protein